MGHGHWWLLESSSTYVDRSITCKHETTYPQARWLLVTVWLVDSPMDTVTYSPVAVVVPKMMVLLVPSIFSWKNPESKLGNICSRQGEGRQSLARAWGGQLGQQVFFRRYFVVWKNLRLMILDRIWCPYVWNYWSFQMHGRKLAAFFAVRQFKTRPCAISFREFLHTAVGG